MTLKIKPILCRKGTMDNYAYILTDTSTDISAIVDASEAEPILLYCQENNIKPQFIFTTHHHFDHVGGNEELKEKFNLKIVAPKIEAHLINNVDITVSDGDEVWLGNSKITAISAPGHTLGHVLWYCKDDKVLFTGDVLFNLCIGGLFEGTPQDMYTSLNKIKQLPDDVVFYPGHEYTKHCLHNILQNDKTAEYVQIATDRIKKQIPVAPVTLEMEKSCNPYLNINSLKDFSLLF